MQNSEVSFNLTGKLAKAHCTPGSQITNAQKTLIRRAVSAAYYMVFGFFSIGDD